MATRSGPLHVLAAAAAGVIVVGAGLASAAVTTDGSLGAKQSLSGAKIAVPASLGRLKGGNLFHSFGRFDVDAGQTVTFTGPSTVKNVLARVTGGQASRIDGTLASGIGGANLVLINPAGVSFGKGSNLSVSGTFTATTADVVKLADGRAFAASGAGDGVLSGATPASFGFTSAAPGTITIRDTSLTAPSARLVGGGIAVSNATLACPAGHLGVAAVRAGTVDIVPATAGRAAGDLRPAVEAVRGPVTLRTGTLTTAGTGGGRLDAHARSLTLGDFSALIAATAGGRSGRGLTVDVTGALTCRDSSIEAVTTGSGNAGPVAVDAGSILLAGSFVSAETQAAGQAGDVTVHGGVMHFVKNTFVSADSIGNGNGAIVRVAGGRLTVDGGGTATQISSDSAAQTGNPGRGGAVVVDVKALAVLNGGMISSSSTGPGGGGSVRVSADRLTLDGKAHKGTNGQIGRKLTAIVSEAAGRESFGAGGGGAVEVRAGTLSIRNGGEISSSTVGTGLGGSVDVRASRLLIDGGDLAFGFTGIASQTQPVFDNPAAAGAVNVRANRISIVNGGAISSDTYGTGAAGVVTVRADRLVIDGAGNAFTAISSASRFGYDGVTGPAGNVNVSAASVSLLGGGQVSSSAFGQGDAGSVSVRATTLSLTGGGTISTSTAKGGNAGAVRVRADAVRVDGADQTAGAAGITSDANAGSTGRGGTVSVTARQLALVNGGVLSSTAFGAGDAGDVVVRADAVRVSNTSAKVLGGILSESDPAATGNGGDITVHARTLDVLGTAQVDASTGGPGRGGRVTVDADRVRVDAFGDANLSASIASRSAPTAEDVAAGKASGPAGDVSVTARSLSILGNGTVSSGTDGFGNAGSIAVRAGHLRVDGTGTDSTVTGINSESIFPALGNAGDVRVRAGTVDVRQGEISVQTLFAGRGGSLTLDAHSLTTGPSGFVTASTTGLGDAGSLRVRADTITLVGNGRPQEGGIQAATSGRGRGGDVAVTAGRLRISDAAEVSAVSTYRGEAGRVDIDAGELTLRDNGLITAAARYGRAGDLTVHAAETIDARDSFLTTRSNAADGGNLTLTAGRAMSFDRSIVTAQAGANGARLTLDPRVIALNRSTINGLAAGTPVNVSIDRSAVLIRSPESLILADNPTLPPDVDLTGALVQFTLPTLGGQTVLAEGCDEQMRKRRLSSFSGRERLGAPPAAGAAVNAGGRP